MRPSVLGEALRALLGTRSDEAEVRGLKAGCVLTVRAALGGSAA